MYYRYTQTSDPMSDWGHAMFAAEDGRWDGPHRWLYDGTDAVDIDTLRDDVIATWDAECWDTYLGDYALYAHSNKDATGEQVADACNPVDIIDSAGIYDSEAMIWLWERILEPRGIYAITTSDGAIVFDRDLIAQNNKAA